MQCQGITAIQTCLHLIELYMARVQTERRGLKCPVPPTLLGRNSCPPVEQDDGATTPTEYRAIPFRGSRLSSWRESVRFVSSLLNSFVWLRKPRLLNLAKTGARDRWIRMALCAADHRLASELGPTSHASGDA